MLDDFWGSFEWGNMEAEMKKVLPDAEIRDIPLESSALSSVLRCRTSEAGAQSGVPLQLAVSRRSRMDLRRECKGIWDEKGRLVVVINHNTDLGDAYEWMDLTGISLRILQLCVSHCREHDSCTRYPIDRRNRTDSRKVRAHGRSPEGASSSSGAERSSSTFSLPSETPESRTSSSSWDIIETRSHPRCICRLLYSIRTTSRE